MNSDSRKRVLDTLQHRIPDKIPIDFGATRFSGIHVKAYQSLRRYLSFAERAAKLYDVWQQLALPEEDLLNLFEVDVVGLHRMKVSFGLSNERWKRDSLDDGSEVLVSSDYEPVIEANGGIEPFFAMVRRWPSCLSPGIITTLLTPLWQRQP